MSTLGPLILLGLAFALLLTGRVIILLVLRRGETTRRPHARPGPAPTVIKDDLFDTSPSENTP